MTKKHLLRFFISLIFCLIGTSVWAEDIVKADSIDYASVERRKQVYQGTFVSLDLFNPVAASWRDGRFESSLTFDVDLWHRLFPTAEFGFMIADIKHQDYKYETLGAFAKLGADYNFINFKSDRKYDHSFYAGCRYGYSYTFAQSFKRVGHIKLSNKPKCD